MHIGFLLYSENHQQCWWFQKALALPSLFIRAKRGTRPFANNKIHAINTAIDIYYFNSGRAIIASGRFFDEPIGSACGMPQGGRCKPPARPVVMTVKRKPPAVLVVPKSFSYA